MRFRMRGFRKHSATAHAMHNLFDSRQTFTAGPNHNQESLMNPQSITRKSRAVLVACAAFALAACASTPEPKEQMAVANSAVDNASGNACHPSTLRHNVRKEALAVATFVLGDDGDSRQLDGQRQAGVFVGFL